MKKVSKHLVDKLIEANRAYWIDYNDDIARVRDAALELEAETGVDVFSWWNIVGDIIKSTGFMPNAKNEKIYCVLRVIGYEPIEEI